MRDAAGQRLQLKSKLLVGAAGVTAAAMSTAAFAADAAPPAADAGATTPAPASVAAPAAAPAQAMTPIDPPKWLPYVDIGGGVGSGFAIGRATAFVPFWQDLDSLAFVRFGADTGHRNTDNDFNLGFGYRTKIDSEWILGAFAGFDSSQTEFNHTFNQFSFGIEAMSADWDIRANAYIAKKDNRAIGDKFQLYIHDTTIAILQGQEAALSGFDGEVGYRVFNTDSTDVRVFAGAYTFHHADVDTAGVGTNFNFPYHDLTGPKLRAEVNVFDLDMLGPQSRLSIEGQVSHDNVHHTSEYIGATLRIALGDPSGAGAQTLDDLDRRMADPVRRNDNVLTQWQFNKPEPVIIYNSTLTSKPTNTLYYAEQKSGAGVGSYADQTTIQDATTRGGAGKNAFIVLTDAGGSTIDATGTTVQSGETLTGAGTFKVRGANSTFPVFTHDFAPGSGPVSLSTTSGNVLNLSGDANIANLSIVGPFVDGIYGANVGNVNISNVTIDGGGAGTNGMVFKQTDTSGTSNITIANSSIKGVTNDGVDLSVSQTGGTSTTNLTFSNGAITAGNHGVNVASTATGSSNATVYAGIHDSTLTTGGVGAEMTGATGGSATLTQTLLIDPTTIHAAGDYGIYIHANITAGTLTQNAVIDDVKLTGTTHGGLAILGGAKGGHVYQNIEVSNLSITGADVPVGIVAYGAHGGKVDQTVTINGLTANNATDDGITLGTFAYSGAIVHQTATLNDIQVSNAGYSGVHAQEIVNGGATGIQTVTITNLTANNEGLNGVYGYVYSYGAASGAPSVAAQYISVDHASLNNNGRDGVLANAYAVGNAVTRQDITVEHATINGNYRGIEVNGYAYTGASAQQNIYFAYDTIQHNTADGVDLHVLAAGDNGFAAQYGTIYEVDASYNGQDGFNIGAAAIAADAEQEFYMVDVTGDHEGRAGLQIGSYAIGYTAGSYTNYAAHVQQNVYAIYGSFSHNARDGVEVYNYAAAGAAIDQTVFLYGLDISHNTDFGVYEQSYATGTSTAMPTHLYADLQVLNSVVDHNGYDGIYQYSESVGSTNQRSHTTISGTDVSYNTHYGLENIAASSDYYATNLQYVSLTSSVFDHNGDSGALFSAYDDYGPGPYGFAGHIVTIQSSDFSYNTRDGLDASAEATGKNGRAEQYFTIYYSSFTHNETGLSVNNYAHDGTYVPGYSCFNVQGTAGGCAIVRSSVIAVGSHFDDNAFAGIVDFNHAKYGGTIYAQSGHGTNPSLYLSGSTVDGNGDDGIDLINFIKYGSAEIQTVGISGTEISHNSGAGLYGLNAVKYSQQYQSIGVSLGSSIDHNAEDGIHIETYSKYSLFQVNKLAVDDSSVSENTGSGIYLETRAKYLPSSGPTPLPGGVFYQGFEATGSTFDNNGDHGVFLTAYATNLLYAYQVVQTQGSDFSGNGTASPTKYGLGAGMYSIHNVYGGQYIYSQNDTFQHNSGGGMGVSLNAVVNKYAPTNQVVNITGDHFDSNTGDGLHIEASSKYGTGLYQTVTAADSTFDENGGYGLFASGYAKEGFLSQLTHIYSYSTTSSASGNGQNGIVIETRASNSGQAESQNTIEGVTASDNAGFGIYLNAYSNATSNTYQHNYVYGNTASGNTRGIDLHARGAGTYQYSYVGSNVVENSNTFGIAGFVDTFGNQYVTVYSLGNTVSGSGIQDYYFFPTGGGSQTVN